MSQYIRFETNLKNGGGGGGGTVTSVGLSLPASVFSVSGSPVTTAGTLTGDFIVQNANKVFAGPTTGADAVPTFRLLVAADIPSLPYVTNVSATAPVVSSGGTTPNISMHVADATHDGYLSSTDWNTFNNKQPAGNYITALTGDATATGPGSVALTLATVNANTGSWGTATQVGTFTVNGKGLITAASNTSIQIAEAQVTNLVSDLAGKQPTGNYITALTGDVTATGPGSVAASLVATTNATITTLSALSLPFSQTTGTVPINRGGTGQTTQTAAFDALAPTTTKGDLIVNNGTNNVRQAVGTDTYVLTADSAQSTGIKWAPTGNTAPIVLAVHLNTNTAFGANAIIVWDTVDIDTNSAFNTGTGEYTIPVTGYYDAETGGVVTGTGGSFYVDKNGSNVGYITTVFSTGINSGGRTFAFTAGDVVSIKTDSAITLVGSNQSFFTLFQVK